MVSLKKARGLIVQTQVYCHQSIPAFAALLVVSLLLSGYSVMLVAPYDETTDRLLPELSVKTETTAIGFALL